jgi:hypothetical protein
MGLIGSMAYINTPETFHPTISSLYLVLQYALLGALCPILLYLLRSFFRAANHLFKAIARTAIKVTHLLYKRNDVSRVTRPAKRAK